VEIQSPDDVRKLIDTVIEKLESGQQHDAADKLKAIQTTAFTTSSEWLGELGLAIRIHSKAFQSRPGHPS